MIIVTPEMSIPAAERIRVFISYSHSDVDWLERVKKHLKDLERSGLVEIWDDTRIQPGVQWCEEINNALSSASIAILLISVDFFASDYIYENELPLLLAAAETSEVVILGLILSPTSIMGMSPLYGYQQINPVSKPLKGLHIVEQEDYLVKLRNEVFRAAKKSLANADKRRGMTHLKNGDVNTAIEYFTRAISHSPDGETYLNLGNAYLRKGDLDRSINSYTAAIDANAANATAYLGRGRAHLKKGNYTKAINDYNKGNKLTTGSVNKKDLAKAYAQRGKYYLNRHEFRNALDDFERADELDDELVSVTDFFKAYIGHLKQSFGNWWRSFWTGIGKRGSDYWSRFGDWLTQIITPSAKPKKRTPPKSRGPKPKGRHRR